jgi:hypothetical protein
MTLTDYITGRNPLPLTRQWRDMKKRRIMLDIAGEHLFPRAETDIPKARDAGRAVADSYTAAMIDALLKDRRLVITLAEDARRA